MDTPVRHIIVTLNVFGMTQPDDQNTDLQLYGQRCIHLIHLIFSHMRYRTTYTSVAITKFASVSLFGIIMLCQREDKPQPKQIVLLSQIQFILMCICSTYTLKRVECSFDATFIVCKIEGKQLYLII